MRAVLLKSALVLACLLHFSSHSFATTHIITVADFIFTPNSLTVPLGDTIHFKYAGGAHTTTSTTIPGVATPWDEPMTAANQNFFYVPTVPGTYNYVCTPHAQMGMTGSFTVTGSSSVNNVSVGAFSIYPNPASTEILVQTNSEDVAVVLTDITGRRMPLQQIAASKEARTFSTADVANGIYFLNIHTSDADITRKVMIQK